MDKLAAFHPKQFSNTKEAWSKGLNQEFWRWGLVFSLGNGMNIAENHVKERLRFIASRLLRKLHGNHYRKHARMVCLSARHGHKASFNEHYHVLIGIDGSTTDWTDWRIAETIKQLDRDFLYREHEGLYPRRTDKTVHVDFEWHEANRMHSYVTRYLQFQNGLSDAWDVWFI